MVPHRALVWQTLAPVLLLYPPQLLSLQLGQPEETAADDGLALPPAYTSSRGTPALFEELVQLQLAILGICYPSESNSYLQGTDGIGWCREYLFSETGAHFRHQAVVPGLIHGFLDMHQLGSMRVTQWVGNTTRARKASHQQLIRHPRNPFAAANLSTVEIARLMSHRRALQYMVKAGHKLGLVLDGGVRKGRYDDSLVSRIAGLIRNVSNYNSSWDLIRLTDCPGACRREEGSAGDATPGVSGYGLEHARLPKCARAYIVSARGARKFLANSLPIVTTVDHLIPLLERTGLMAVYDPVDPPLVPSPMPNAGGTLDVLPEQSSYCPVDPSFDVWYERQVMEAAYRPLLTGELPALPKPSKVKTQLEIMAQQCSFVSKASSNVTGEPDDNTREVLRYMKRLDLKGFLVYDFRTRIHSHAFIHEAIHNAFTQMARFSPEPLHVCWLEPQELQGVSLTQALGYSPRNKFRRWRGRLGSSLVMASPKHMSWSNDPGVAMLARDATSRYVFHDFVPEQFRSLQEQGKALQWVVFGRDGGHARLESVNWLTQERFPWRLTWADLPQVAPMPCEGPVCSDLESRTYVAPWATSLLPQQINASMDLGGRLTVAPRSAAPNASQDASRAGDEEDGLPQLHYVGSVWSGNDDEMYHFISGCHKARILVSGNGWQGIEQVLGPAAHFAGGARISASELQARLLSAELFAPAVQGSAHLFGNLSYIPDRLLTIAASGRLLGTNNPAVAKFFAPYKDAIVFRKEARLCDAYVDALQTPSSGREDAVRGLMQHIADEHTYASRFKDLLALFTAVNSSVSMS